VTQDVDVVIHLAAVVRNPFSFEYSREFEQVNHWGAAHLIEACIEGGVRRLVYVGSTAVYDPAIDLTEDAPTRPVGSFAESLLNAEHAVRAANVRGLPATILRAGVVYGGAANTRFDEVVNRLIVLAATGRPITIFGDGEQRRPVVHVRDVCDAIAFSLTNTKTEHQTFNVAESNPSIVEIKDSILDARPDVRVRFTEQDLRTRLSFSVSAQKFRSVGWEPSFTLHDGIRGLLAQFRGFADWRAAASEEDS
jgi:UDP-glucose 4-epimerase